MSRRPGQVLPEVSDRIEIAAHKLAFGFSRREASLELSRYARSRREAILFAARRSHRVAERLEFLGLLEGGDRKGKRADRKIG
jgi:hypothetical protein